MIKRPAEEATDFYINRQPVGKRLTDMKQKCALGIDTSNYKTSVAAVTESGKIVSDRRIFLNVKEGALGLRQSEALFQHTVNLPGLLEEVMGDVRAAGCQLGIVAASAAPRPQAGSYMPAFLAGMGAGRAAAAAAGCPYVEFSHQEGHIMAVKFYSSLSGAPAHISMHLSGGTTELLYVKDNICAGSYAGTDFVPPMDIEICGGSLDISFGQLLDRAGQKMGFDFPAGERIDRLALEYADSERLRTSGNEAIRLPAIKVIDGRINLSGIETAVKKTVDAGCDHGELSFKLMEAVSKAIIDMAEYGCRKHGVGDVLLAGGVASSAYLRKSVESYVKAGRADSDDEGINIVFGKPELSSDNAVGSALLGATRLNGRV